ncbi:VOC family protein [Bosea sp. (in: a-proteobacteria)]|jgi:catechol 2,3-dioxygenase-like lactoylglutathione lyase family enzyme|uniref:VOC family protein n=1 Tax=Bosea sp. (in: a-proteobacteria) TaxID=1871050 RepID=UPI002DDD0004|nr:VOC family protein [Bosea sp. (in: a-proteobacteria)]HEV2509004.1 VOC family protein [Bosea sp. (in: a-proteobacteria)]
MIIYTTVGVDDLARALRFYDPLFAEMGLEQCWLDATSASWGRKDDPSVSRFSIGYPFEGEASAGNGTMTALRADNPAQVDRLHRLSLCNGGKDEGGPGHRPRYGGDFYGAYVRDPDGNKLAFICYDSVV